MLTYSTLAMLYLIYIGVRGEAVGLLLWPAVVVHAVLVVLLVGARFKDRKTLARGAKRMAAVRADRRFPVRMIRTSGYDARVGGLNECVSCCSC